jgi:hypothetical protein
MTWKAKSVGLVVILALLAAPVAAIAFCAMETAGGDHCPADCAMMTPEGAAASSLVPAPAGTACCELSSGRRPAAVIPPLSNRENHDGPAPLAQISSVADLAPTLPLPVIPLTESPGNSSPPQALLCTFLI